MFSNLKELSVYKSEYVNYTNIHRNHNKWVLEFYILNNDKFKIYNAIRKNSNLRYLHIYLNNNVYNSFDIIDFYISILHNLIIVSNIDLTINSIFENIDPYEKIKFEYIIENNFCDLKINLN